MDTLVGIRQVQVNGYRQHIRSGTDGAGDGRVAVLSHGADGLRRGAELEGDYLVGNNIVNIGAGGGQVGGPE